MFILLFINLVFSAVTVTDNCTSDYCKIEVKSGVRILKKINHISGINKSSWHLDASRYSSEALEVVYSNAGSEGQLLGKMELGKKAKKVSQDILNLISGHNLGLSLTTAQINQLKITYASAKTYLDDGQPWGAKAEIANITPDGAIVTQELLDQINVIFSESGLPGL